MRDNTGFPRRIGEHLIKRNPRLDSYHYRCVHCYAHSDELDSYHDIDCE